MMLKPRLPGLRLATGLRFFYLLLMDQVSKNKAILKLCLCENLTPNATPDRRKNSISQVKITKKF